MEKYQLLRTPIPSIKVDDSACDVDDLAKCGGVQVSVPGTDSWAALVQRAVDSEWTGIEALAGFDGTVAEAVRNNYAAYGQEVADTLMSVRTWDTQEDAQRTFASLDARLGEGTSRLMEQLAGPSAGDGGSGQPAATEGALRYEVLDVDFLFVQGNLTRPIVDDDLAALLGVEKRTRVPLRRVAEAVGP